MMKLRLIAAVPLMLLAMPVVARESLGVFGSWGAFRDPGGQRCYAIAEPARRGSTSGSLRAFASVGNWPQRGIRGQAQFRLSKERRTGAAATLSIGDRRFTLTGGTSDLWAADRRADAAIIAAIRSGNSMSVESVGTNGRPFADVYGLRGAATAIDAAALGCAKAG